MKQTGIPTFVIFSGLPGTGKSTLANCLSRELQWPLLRIDDVAGTIPENADYHFWDEKVSLLLSIAEEQLKLGISVIADSIFMGADRLHAQEISGNQGALFCPVYCYPSDEKIWEKRVNARVETFQHSSIASWEQIKHQSQWFAPWKSGTGLFIDAVDPVEQNYAEVIEFVSNPTFSLEPLEVNTPLVRGQYHA